MHRSSLHAPDYRVLVVLLVASGSLLWATPVLQAAAYLDVVISELMYHAPGADIEREYVELTNHGTETVDLTGWRLADGCWRSSDVSPGSTRSAVSSQTVHFKLQEEVIFVSR